MIVGIDEAGRGPLAGPLAVCALALKDDFPFSIKDSKKLSIKKREFIFSWILDHCLYVVELADLREIESFNISGATYLAGQRAIVRLIKNHPKLKKAYFIVDGIGFKTNLDIKYTCLKKADEKIAEVACASVVAKVTRDYVMRIADFVYPDWDFCQNKGYPTKKHYDLIEKHKVSPLHRRNFIKGIY